MRAMIPLLACVLLLAGTVSVAQDKLPADPKAAAIRTAFEKFQGRVVTISFVTRVSAMGQELETQGSATGVMIGDKGMILCANQPFVPPSMGGFGGRGGRGGSTPQPSGPQDLTVKLGEKSHPVVEAHVEAAMNLRFFGVKLAEGEKFEGAVMPEKVEVPALAEEVLVIGAWDATLNHARFFRSARINAVIETGKTYGLDGSLGDCLGALVVTLDGRVLGVVGQKQSDSGADAIGGIGRMLGGLNDPGRAMGNRILMTPSAIAEPMKKATEKIASPDFGKAAPAETPSETPSEKPVEPKPEDKPRNWRGVTRVLKVGESVLRGRYGDYKAGFMVSIKPAGDTPCGKAGVLNGDLIVKVGEIELKDDLTIEQFWEVLDKTQGAVTLTVVRRGGTKSEIKVE